MCANATNGASCSSRDVACQCQLYMKYSDTGGFQGGLAGLSVGRTLVIKGQSTPQATRLVINLNVRDSSSSSKETDNNALHLNVDFGTKKFTVNAKVKDNWSSKLTGSLPQQNPFGPGLPFEIVIKCGSGAFQLTFNGGPQQDFAYQVQDLQAINLLLVWQVEQIHVQLK
nr:galectin-4 [Syngnathus scovelli]